MRRILLTALALLAIGGAAVVTAGAGESSSAPRYWVELDHAFGLVPGADLKIGGVRAGKIVELDVDRKTNHALVQIEIAKTGFGSFRKDVFCETRPQSLIGEYFVDCKPGSSSEELPENSLIPIAQTASTVAPDLVNDILRRPYAERLRIILNELGAGVAGRAGDLNAAIRRAVPALRETDGVLAILARQNRTLRQLTEDADAVLTPLADNHKDVGRWVLEARDASRDSAERRVELAATFRKLPAFLAELGPTMRELGNVAGEQAPALRDLDASAKQLNTFFDRLAPFADASRKSLVSLGKAAAVGDKAVKEAGDEVAELGRFAPITPELGKNLAIVLEDLDDRDRAVEKSDKRANGGQGYSGIESILQYVFDQALAVNFFDQNGYLLRVNAFVSECSAYQNADSLKAQIDADPDFYKKCSSQLGPNQPGTLGQPDPTKTAASKKRSATQKRQTQQAPSKTPTAKAPSGKRVTPQVDLGQTLRQLLGGFLGGSGPLSGSGPQADSGNEIALLDYLLSP